LQAFWLDGSHPDGLAPGKRPRTTLTPTIVTRRGDPYLAFGTPGDDKQDQWGLQFLLNVVEFGMDIQDAADEAAFHTEHFASSFHPRVARPNELVAESTLGSAVLDELRSRGHDVRAALPLSLGNITAVGVDPESGVLEASASSRGQKAYALGW
jgi:gamma-glutamyltranspeptidase/glutathione hydrolase